MWYMPGGQLFAYIPIAEFLKTKCQKEAGLELEPDALIGFYRNDGPDKAASVIAPCYCVFVPWEAICKTQPADGHDQWRLFTEADLDALPETETHWYPMYVWRRALATAIDFNIR
jgi:ADP-ribose pyrophosphatase YjhB (NUDIX family)